MESETFTLRKKFLEEFYKDRVKLVYSVISFCQDGVIDLNDPEEVLNFKTYVEFYEDDLNINTKEVYKLIKLLIYYLYSITYKKKFVRENLFLFTENIIIKYRFLTDYTTNTKINTDIHIDYFNDYEGDNLLEYYNEKKLSENQVVNSLFYLKIFLKTFYVFESYEDYVASLEKLEENNEVRVNRPEKEHVVKKIINSSQTFKNQ